MELKSILAGVCSIDSDYLSCSIDYSKKPMDDFNHPENNFLKTALEVDIIKLSLDSRTVSKGYAFIAIPGVNSNGCKYINSAILNGAKAVIAQHSGCNSNLLTDVIPELGIYECSESIAKSLKNGISYEVKPENIINSKSTSNFEIIFYKEYKDFFIILIKNNLLEDGFALIPVFVIRDLYNKLSVIAKNFFGFEDSNLHKVAITGTNGKTSCAHYIAKIFDSNGISCGTIGTLGVGINDNFVDTGLTTPDCISVYEFLAHLERNQIKAVAIEASSHALTQNRLSNLDFNTVIFTNLTQDHLDYHGSIEEYWNAKKKLFYDFNYNSALINIDDQYGKKLYFELKNNKDVDNNKMKIKNGKELNILSYSIYSNNADIYVKDSIFDFNGIKAEICTPWGDAKLNTGLIGEFNLSNLLAGISAVCLQGVEFKKAILAANEITPVKGRMMCFGGDQKPLVVVDYAHTPDAITQVLKTLKPLTKGELVCIFGCGGSRDRGKRSLMLKAAKEYANKIIISQDNTRNEPIENIIFDIFSEYHIALQQHFKRKSINILENPKVFYDNIDEALEIINFLENKNNLQILIELDRSNAVKEAILNSNNKDIVLLAGKGHETCQILGDEKYYFSDIEEANKYLDQYLTFK